MKQFVVTCEEDSGVAGFIQFILEQSTGVEIEETTERELGVNRERQREIVNTLRGLAEELDI